MSTETSAIADDTIFRDGLIFQELLGHLELPLELVDGGRGEREEELVHHLVLVLDSVASGFLVLAFQEAL